MNTGHNIHQTARTGFAQPAFRLDIPAVATTSTDAGDGYFNMRPWQQRCFDELRDSPRWIVNAPMAAGKSFQICAMASHRLGEDQNLRVIITVPQTIIAAGFRKNKMMLPDGTRVEWSIREHLDLCRGGGKSNVSRILTFLEEPPATILMDRVVLCTHATLVRAFDQKPAAFKNVLLVIDEAHHIKQGLGEGVTKTLENKMGALLNHALNSEDTIRVGLTTATFFRGDKVPIISTPSSFKRFDLPYDEFLASCEHLRSFSYDFLFGMPLNTPVKTIFDERIGKTIVYIPPAHSVFSQGKHSDVMGVLKAIAGAEQPVIEGRHDPIMRVQRGDKWIRVVDLVDVANREEKKRVIEDAHASGETHNIDVVIALGMFKEGANWRYADREIILGPRNSLTEVIQCIGRLFRDVPGKEHVEVFHLLPFTFDMAEGDAVRVSLNRFMKAVFLSMILEDIMVPDQEETAIKSKNHGGGSKRINYLREAAQDETQAAAVMNEIYECVVNELATASVDDVTERFGDIVSTVLTGHGVHQHHREIASQVLRMFDRRSKLLKGLNVDHVRVDLVKHTPFDCLLRYGTQSCGATTFKDLRAAIKRVSFRPFPEAREFARSLDLKDQREWREWCGRGLRPQDIPCSPPEAYSERGWSDWGDWLGTGRGRRWRPFGEAREEVRARILKTRREYLACLDSGLLPNLPRCPHVTYKDAGWINWSDWLGVQKGRTWRPMNQAREFARSLGLRTKREWDAFRERPTDIPFEPDVVYGNDGWNGWADWLGYTKYASFQDAREFALSLGLHSSREWFAYPDLPSTIPRQPQVIFKNAGWKSWGDWLGTGNRFRAGKKARRCKVA